MFSNRDAVPFRGNYQRTGFFDVEIDVSRLEISWEFKSRRHLYAPPVVVSEQLYIGSNVKTVYAIDTASGHPRWEFKTNHSIQMAPLLVDDLLLIGARDGTLHALNRISGNEVWRFDAGKPFSKAAALAGDVLIFGSDDWWNPSQNGALIGFNYKNQTLRWRIDIPVGIFAAPAISSDGEIGFCGGRDQTLYAFDPKTGKLNWRYKVEGEILSTACVTSTGIYVCCDDTYVYGFNHAGQLKWRFKTGSPLMESTPAAADGHVFVGTSDGCLYRFDEETGEAVAIIKDMEFEERPTYYSPSLNHHYLFCGNSDGKLVVVGRDSLEIVRSIETVNSGPWTPIHLAENSLYFAGFGRTLYAVGSPPNSKRVGPEGL
ncbi:MAG: PQQ-binding-like beta-propeller repeat protein [Chloroflexota bacterium]